MFFIWAANLPRSLKKEAISCRWMTIVGGTTILASRRWLGWLFPGGPWPSWSLVLLRRSPLLIWREFVLLGLTPTVTDGVAWHQWLVCFIMF